MSVFSHVWGFIQDGVNVLDSKDKCVHVPRRVPPKVRDEFLMALATLGLAYFDLKLKVSDVLTCSDASELGGGVCVSTSLDPSSFPDINQFISREASRAPACVLLISAFNGISSSHQILSVLEVPLVGSVAVEPDPQANRVTRTHFPQTEIIDCIKTITLEVVEEWARKYAGCKIVLLTGGPPCQGVSGLNASRKGAMLDPRSSLAFDFQKLREMVVSVFSWAKVLFLAESVASMDASDLEVYSDTFDLQPVEICASGVSCCRRNRLYWVNWRLFEEKGVNLEIGRSFNKVLFTVEPPDSSSVFSEGWEKVDVSQPFPTFTRPIIRNRPGYSPAGINKCD